MTRDWQVGPLQFTREENGAVTVRGLCREGSVLSHSMTAESWGLVVSQMALRPDGGERFAHDGTAWIETEKGG